MRSNFCSEESGLFFDKLPRNLLLSTPLPHPQQLNNIPRLNVSYKSIHVKVLNFLKSGSLFSYKASRSRGRAEVNNTNTKRKTKQSSKRTMAVASSAYLINSKSELFVTDPSRTLRQKTTWVSPTTTNTLRLFRNTKNSGSVSISSNSNKLSSSSSSGCSIVCNAVSVKAPTDIEGLNIAEDVSQVRL